MQIINAGPARNKWWLMAAGIAGKFKLLVNA